MATPAAAMEGLTLKNWKLGEKIGAGACSDVFTGAFATLSARKHQTTWKI